MEDEPGQARRAALQRTANDRVDEHHGVFPARSWRYDAASAPLFKSRFDQLIVEAAKKFDVDAALVSAVIKAESDFNPRATSRVGAQGLGGLTTVKRGGVHGPSLVVVPEPQ